LAEFVAGIAESGLHAAKSAIHALMLAINRMLASLAAP